MLESVDTEGIGPCEVNDGHRRLCALPHRNYLVRHGVWLGCGCSEERPVVTRQQVLLDRATVCLRLLKDNTSNPDNQRTLECLRELWKELALQIWLLPEAEIAEQLEALSDVQASIVAEIRQTMH